LYGGLIRRRTTVYVLWWSYKKENYCICFIIAELNQKLLKLFYEIHNSVCTCICHGKDKIVCN